MYYVRNQKKGLFWPPGLVVFPFQREIHFEFEWPMQSLKWTPDGTGSHREGHDVTDPWGDGLRRDCMQKLLTQNPLFQTGEKRRVGSGSQRTLVRRPVLTGLCIYMLTSQQRSISFMSRTQWLRTPLWVNNVPKYQSCDWIQPPGKSVGFKEITTASTQDNGPEILYWV